MAACWDCSHERWSPFVGLWTALPHKVRKLAEFRFGWLGFYWNLFSLRVLPWELVIETYLPNQDGKQIKVVLFIFLFSLCHVVPTTILTLVVVGHARLGLEHLIEGSGAYGWPGVILPHGQLFIKVRSPGLVVSQRRFIFVGGRGFESAQVVVDVVLQPVNIPRVVPNGRTTIARVWGDRQLEPATLERRGLCSQRRLGSMVQRRFLN